MLNQTDQLTELVRKLEQKNHVFAADPLLITEKLQPKAGEPHQKLGLRAKQIDADGTLALTLQKIDTRIKGIIFIMSIVWCVTGFVGLFALLQSHVVNFFYVLVCVLGVHTLMLMAWVAFAIAHRGKQTSSIITHFLSPKMLIRGKDDVTESATQLYDMQLQHTSMRWYLSRFSHQLWLATLTGMLFAIVFLLIVRQYSFSWESTLLSDDTLLTLTGVLGWLPHLVGFSVPDADAVIQSRKVDVAMPLSIARQWAGLLIGSLLVYGIIPRAIAWAFCNVMFARNKMSLDISLPYYQKIIHFWQRQVVDADDFSQVITPTAPPAAISDGKKLVVLLEYPYASEDWYPFTIGRDAEYFGILDDREDMDKLLSILDDQSMQVYLGVQMSTLPDRGVMRKLDKIANHAKQGLVVQLLDCTLEQQTDEQNDLRYEQWQAALAQRQIGLV